LEKPLSNALIIFDGRQADGAVSGKLTGKGNYAGDVVSLAADIASANGTISIGGLNARFGPTVIKGSLSTNDDGLITSDLTVSSKNIRSAAAFALLEASGAVDARIVLEPKPDGTQSAQVTAKIRKLKVDGNSVGSGDITADAKDLFGALLIDLQFDGKDITAGGVDIAEASATAQTMGERTTFNARARLTNDSRLSASGAAVRKGDLTDLTVQEMELTSAIADARLTKAARISIENGTVQVSAFDLAVGNGRISAEGVAGKTLDFKVVFKNLPLEAANAVKPDLGLAGSLSGSAHITGEPSDPTAVFEVDGNGISANQLAEYDVSVIDVQARGSFKSGTVRIERATASRGSASRQMALSRFRARASISMPMAAGRSAWLNRCCARAGLH
jgi:translocation and assembly module TamB